MIRKLIKFFLFYFIISNVLFYLIFIPSFVIPSFGNTGISILNIFSENMNTEDLSVLEIAMRKELNKKADLFLVGFEKIFSPIPFINRMENRNPK